MYLQHLSLVNFKNYHALEIDLSAKINCFTGNNGVGKTNILDAIYYLSFCKSFFTTIDSMNIHHGDTLFVIEGKYNFEKQTEHIYCGFENGKKKIFKRNKKEYNKLANHIGLIPLVMISPYDINLILGGSEERRKFIDGIISQFDREYLNCLQQYNKVLAQRNHLLKNHGKYGAIDEEVLNIYDDQLSENGNIIHGKRMAFIHSIQPVFQKFFSHISQGKEQVELIYNSQLTNKNFATLLKEHRQKDLVTRYSNAGIHKDELELQLGDYPIRKLGSQGQQKSYLIALKFAQFEYTYSLCGFKPILLLDDVFDKLDHDRVAQIIKLVADNSFGQIFITDTNPERIKEVLQHASSEYLHYKVNNAQLVSIHEKE